MASLSAWAAAHSTQVLVFASVFLSLVFLGHTVWFRPRRKRRWAGQRNRTARRGAPASEVVALVPRGPNIADPKEQLDAVSRVEFETQRLLNREEVPVLRLLEQVAREANCGFRVMAQTSLGEIIRPKPGSGTEQELQLAFRSINSKRIDLGIFDRFGRLIIAVEYQGSGHYHRTSFMRDAVKQEALRKAGVQFIPIETGFEAGEVTPRLRRALGIVAAADRQEGKGSAIGERTRAVVAARGVDPAPAAPMP